MMIAALLIATAISAPVPKEVDEKFDKDVEAARSKGIKYLRTAQKTDGSWEEVALKVIADLDGGETALVTLSLLEAGVPVNDPTITKAIDFLLTVPVKKTYVVSLQTQVLARVDAKKHKERIQKNADWLMEEALRTKDSLDGWSYPGNQIADGSNTHFAVIGLHSASQAGAKVDERIWKQIEDLYIRTRKDKGWPYYNTEKEVASNSMTVCALTGLLIASKHDKNANGPDAAFEKGLKVLVPWYIHSEKSTGYAMMAVAELGRLHGSTEFKSEDKTWRWYRAGVETLFKSQKEDGEFIFGTNIDANPVISTAFALYFLGPPAKKKP